MCLVIDRPSSTLESAPVSPNYGGEASQLSLEYFAASLGETQERICDFIDAGMPTENISAARAWLWRHLNPSPKRLLWGRSEYFGERNAHQLPHGWGR